MRLGFVLASAVVVASCGGGDARPGSATFGGSVRGNSFTPRDAISDVGFFTNANGAGGRGAFISVTSAPSICSDRTRGKQRRSTQYLLLALFKPQPDSSPIPPSPGVYQVGTLAIQNATALFATTDATCGVDPANTVPASTGTITLTAVGDRYSGSYELFFEFGDSVRGTFDAPVCGVNGGSLESGTLTCE